MKFGTVKNRRQKGGLKVHECRGSSIESSIQYSEENVHYANIPESWQNVLISRVVLFDKKGLNASMKYRSAIELKALTLKITQLKSPKVEEFYDEGDSEDLL